VRKLSTLNFRHGPRTFIRPVSPISQAKHKMKASSGLVRFLLVLVVFISKLPLAQSQEQTKEPNKVESISLTGSSRLTADQIYDQLRINTSTLMTDQWLADARRKILGLAVYKDVIFILRKGSRPGYAKLHIIAVDDESVITAWAIGGELGVSLLKPSPDFGDDSLFQSYRFGLVSRNLLNRAHRGSLNADVNANGELSFATIAYGLPRFASEAIQFDAALHIIDPGKNYLNTEGFGMKVQSIWTRQRFGLDLNYGLVWYSNRHHIYSLPNWPSLVSGPKIGLIRETRLRSFLPGDGYKAEIAIIPSLVNRKYTTIEAELLNTHFKQDWGALTYSAKGLQIGREHSSIRGELRYELPITTSSHGLRSLLYVSRRIGQDRFGAIRHTGSETVAGYRYHSSGFIGDINFKISSDNPLAPKSKKNTFTAVSIHPTHLGSSQ
jgi:hypothetical protein